MGDGAAEFELVRTELLAEAVKALEGALPPMTPARIGAGRSPWDVLLDGLEVRDVREALRGLQRGAGGELKPSRGGNVRFCSAESSALMVVNFLAPFISRPGLLGMSHGTLSFERELRIEGVRSRVGPTLDAVFEAEVGSVLIEAKTAEPWRSPPEVSISEQYDVIAAATSTGTLETLKALRSGVLAYRCLDAAQLLKHLLGATDAVRRAVLPAPARIVVLFWKPSVTGRYQLLFAQLERELDDFAQRLADQPITLAGLSSATLLDEWSTAEAPVWLRGHGEALRDRYDVSLSERRENG